MASCRGEKGLQAPLLFNEENSKCPTFSMPMADVLMCMLSAVQFMGMQNTV